MDQQLQAQEVGDQQAEQRLFDQQRLADEVGDQQAEDALQDQQRLADEVGDKQAEDQLLETQRLADEVGDKQAEDQLMRQRLLRRQRQADETGDQQAEDRLLDQRALQQEKERDWLDEGEPPSGPLGEDQRDDSASTPYDVWPEEYSVPTESEEPLEVTLSPNRGQRMLDLAESGNVRGAHTDQDLHLAIEDAISRRQDGPLSDGRSEYEKLRARTDFPDDLDGPVHHYSFPIRENPEKATEPENLYGTRAGTEAHKEFHRAFGEEGRPYREMAEGLDEPGIKHTFDFAQAHIDADGVGEELNRYRESLEEQSLDTSWMEDTD